MVTDHIQVDSAGLSRRQFLRVVGVAAVAGTTMVGSAVPAVGSAVPAKALTINPRSSWAIDRPPLGPLPGEDVRFLLVHHSASQNGHTTADAPGIIRGFYDYHTGPEKGWNDIAYNFLIDSGGGIWEGRSGSIDGSVAGDATGGNQGFSQLVCVIGDYNAATPTAASLESLVGLLAWMADKHGVATAPGSMTTFVSRGSNKWPAGESVTTDTITGHRNMSLTTCPGDNLYSYVVGGLMADVTAARSGAPAPTTVPAEPSSTTTAPPSTTTSSAQTSRPPQLTSSLPDATAATEPARQSVPATVPPGSPSAIPDSSSAATIAALEPTSVEAAPAAGPSVLIWAGAGLASLVTALVAWRFRRMS